MIVGWSRTFGPVLPLTDLGLRFDPSISGSMWQTLTVPNNPAWSNPAGDGQAVEAESSIVPGSPNERILTYRSLTSQSPLYQVNSPALPLPDTLYDGVNDETAVTGRTGSPILAISNFIGASAATILIAFQIHACTLNSGNAWVNSPIIGDTASFLGMFVRRSSTGPDVHQLQFYNWDGNQDVVEIQISLNTNYVACWRHDGTNLYGSINGGSESSVASGATSSLTGGLGVGGGLASGTVFSNISIGEILVYNANKTGGDLSAANTYMTSKWT